MFIKIDFESDMPIYEQLRRQIIKGIAKGDLEKGEQLPSVRQLAEDIGINLHTVNKTYNILKEEGYLAIDRRKGAMVKDIMPMVDEEYINNLYSELEYIIANSYCRGISKEEFLKLCEDIYDRLENKQGGEKYD
ncbi:GntR family transcriptional regulator [Keratinibaculum paraultunense]|uniref:GntR family transcriptional regulator n=1 Tax=Keratinibaculum paraultunense TaxID=1278232 RepID=A0A4R3L0W0_9FIRM|nr:GntR family transcriptional regulator [Keratinibaculum paraultunense]NLV77531.1 GntR family transcriptional regulator [Tissierellia bacterium]QQY80006.1 GntR family transcriptional regulator [Keratinibaculum paraultunense]TCS91671.1 GntR family transcriptional regulator [Keratinibaculum paraultunense]